MLFNSPEFIFAFLPFVLVLHYLLGRLRYPPVAIVALIASSAFFYAWWNPSYLLVVATSIVLNFALGRVLEREDLPALPKRSILALGVTLNLGALGYYKYANFTESVLAQFFGHQPVLETIVLPLAISFFTFQQISYLVDAYQGLTREHNFLRYCLFVLFFPQLIAGPIVHHAEMLSQFAREETFRPETRRFAIGLSIFAIGLFKKVVIADTVALYATPVFAAADAAQPLGAMEAWTGALAYTMQLYYDFSGYSDMAIGLGFLFGIRLPLNFFSPYKSTNIIEFWRRWHMTLSRFLRDYLYIPLGGNRRGVVRRYLNLVITMVLGGLWHGAGWNFLLWGSLHGAMLAANHLWRDYRPAWAPRLGSLGLVLSWLATMLGVVVGWVFFRAETFSGAIVVLEAMVGLGAGSTGVVDPGLVPIVLFLVLAGATVLVPSVYELFAHEEVAIGPPLDEPRPVGWRISWRPDLAWALATALLASTAILSLNRVSEFLYFQF